ncbi:hypothetical protein TrCOL_g10406, partial [Triparma columacea]
PFQVFAIGTAHRVLKYRTTCDDANNAIDIANLAHEFLNGQAPDWSYAADAHAEMIALSKSLEKIDPHSPARSRRSLSARLTRTPSSTFSQCQFGAGAKSDGHS